MLALLNVVDGLVSKVGVVEFGVVTALPHEIVMGAHCEDAAMIEHHDTVGMLDCPEPVCDDD